MTEAQLEGLLASFAMTHDEAIASHIAPALTRAASCGSRLMAHPLGMLSMDLGKMTHTKIRLHVWPATSRISQDADLEVHSHSWTLISRVLVGAITNETHYVTPERDGPHELLTVKYQDTLSRSTLHASGVFARTRIASTARFPAGSVYGLPVGSFHRAFVPAATFTATLVAVVAGPPDSVNRVVAPRSRPSQYSAMPIEFLRRPVPQEQTNLHLRTLLTALGA